MLLNWIYALEERRLLGYERHIAQIFSHALVHTEIEKGDFERLIPGIPVTVVGKWRRSRLFFGRLAKPRSRDPWFLPG